MPLRGRRRKGIAHFCFVQRSSTLSTSLYLTTTSTPPPPPPPPHTPDTSRSTSRTSWASPTPRWQPPGHRPVPLQRLQVAVGHSRGRPVAGPHGHLRDLAHDAQQADVRRQRVGLRQLRHPGHALLDHRGEGLRPDVQGDPRGPWQGPDRRPRRRFGRQPRGGIRAYARPWRPRERCWGPRSLALLTN